MRYAALVLLAALGTPPALAAELVFGGSPEDCARIACPPGVNCDILIRPACRRCVADPSKSFVIRCGDASCSSFGAMTCEAARPAPSADAVPPECREAKINVDWVISRDAGARATYARLRAEGLSPIDAVIGAQGHNPHAQETLRLCAGWVSRYLAAQGMGSGGMSPAARTPGRAPSSCSVAPKNGCAECSITCTVGQAVCKEGSGGYWEGRLMCNIESSCRCYPSR
ncbi:MAG TPA: hypothetical protein VF211_09250 [Burkholderiales bacterium]